MFLDTLYSIYSQSPKNQNEILEISAELNSQCMKIGKIFDIRWVSSSFRTIRAVWCSFRSLNAHFEQAMNDPSRDGRERQKFKGLKAKLGCKEFLLDLAVMYDILSELSELSLKFQKRNMTIPQADKLLKRTIRVIQSFKDEPGDKVSQALLSVQNGIHESVSLSTNSKLIKINHSQFIQSIVDNLQSRISTDNEFLNDLKIFEKETLQDRKENIRFGEPSVRRLAKRFQLNEERSIHGIRAFNDGDIQSDDIMPLIRALETIPCSSAECERAFSIMNTIVCDKRSQLLIKNVSSLMFCNLNGPPVKSFDPSKYTKKWLADGHRTVSETQSRVHKHISNEFKSFWNIL
jgi:hypothetical protein